ncbi:CHAT domain-containing protein [Methylomonas sp. LL1]|uniref:CHAT domain-containing protein n=1 Tax=Methylomonas sp. LL1 TaxID=2785785 RepID=UPI0018C3703E|nr:CHAT domain-containing protein [Methylomonas sp. LL1]QPK65363.1 CHAT domain-containing protein [Methylomonas sp. LL1]
MNSRTVIWIQETDQNKPQMCLLEPQTHPEARMGKQLKFKAKQPFQNWKQGDSVSGPVQKAGSQLYQCLTSHKAIEYELGVASVTTNGNKHPIYFYLDPPEIDELPWETLYDVKMGFLALDARWPIARLKIPLAQIKLEYEFSPPLRMLAVLSAPGGNSVAQVPAREEWDSIYEALQAANLEFKLRVFVCEESLKQHIDSLNDARVKVDYVIDKYELTQGIVNFAPHLLHFFCHGTADKLPYLQIGNRADWEVERDGSIILEANELRQTADPNQNVWLVTLNCCESAMQAKDARNLASALVSAGFPSAVGMREPVASIHAHAFCKLFYRGVLELINTAQVGGVPTTIEWASALWKARQKLLDNCAPRKVPATEAAPNCREWTIPVLYTRREPFLLRRAQKSNGMTLPQRLGRLAELDELKRQRDEFAARPDVDPGIRQKILNEFENEIRRIEDELKN